MSKIDQIDIKGLLNSAAKQLRAEFEEIKNTNPHYGERGGETENILKTFLNEHLPKRFNAGSGFVIDNDGGVSSQIDVLVYDAENSPIYRAGERSLILHTDNVAGVIEVKSNLDKAELEDAAKKIASVKKLRRTPVNEADQPVTFSLMINTKTHGVVFAYESKTSLETLANNLKEINSRYPSDQWIDLVVVLDKGIVGYTVQMPFEKGFPGWFGGPTDDEFPPPPMYVHLVKADLGELTLNKFFVDLVAHLTFYRKRSTVDFNSALGPSPKETMTLHAYQYDLNRQLRDVTEDHEVGKFDMPVRFNLFQENEEKRVFVGQICRKPWQDGAVLTWSGNLHPDLIFGVVLDGIKDRVVYLPAMKGEKFWVTSVTAISEDDFIARCESIKGEMIAVRDRDEDTGLTGVEEIKSQDLQ